MTMGRIFQPILLLMVALLPGTAWAGQAGPASKPQDQMTIEELRAYQGFFYSGGGRDPLIMRFPTESERGLARKSGPRKAPSIQEQESMLAGWLEEITLAIKDLRYNQAIAVAADAINVIDNEWPPLKSENSRAVRMNDEIRGLSRMATRLKSQKDINREFFTLGLRVDGVIWSPTDARAVVNGKLYSAGEVMLQERKDGDLRLEMIEEYGVIFQYRGMRFRLPIMLYPPPVSEEIPEDDVPETKKKE